MSHITEAGASTISYGWLLGVTTAFFIAAFSGWVLMLYRRSARPTLDAAARLPLED